ncbi:hypothetical protein V865_004022 [Kwoniella europaea PYCC6329]|uniref:BRCT domain-containing protein n=1 Tax=Kwoniella europaea PYCC6329 TaxID=1423913 RepID=A0AAX4KHR7_9TREE
MTSPRPRRQTTSTSHTSIRAVSGAPHTRSSARLAASTKKKAFTVYDENATTTSAATKSKPAVSSSTTKDWGSRGPLRESRGVNKLNMNALEGRRESGDGKGKRKMIEDDESEKGKKILKVEQGGSSIGTGLSKRRNSIGHQSSNESLRSIQSSNSSTTPSSFSFVAPTPARDLLKKVDGTTSLSDSPPGHVIARPPTPPRMKELPSTNILSTPKPASTSTSPQKTDRPLSKMPASLRKTPGPSLFTVPSSFNARPIPSTPSHHPTNLSMAKPSITPNKLAASPRKVFNTTPSAPPPSTLSRMPKSLVTPSTRVVPPSPSSSRLSPMVSERKDHQPTLDAFMRKNVSTMDVTDRNSPYHKHTTAEQPFKMEETIHIPSAPRDIHPSSDKSNDVEMGIRKRTEPQVTPTSSLYDSAGTSNKEDALPLAPTDTDVSQSDFSHPPREGQPLVGDDSSSLSLPKGTSTRTLGTMGPPSRIPISKPAKPSTGLGALPERRPSTKPSMISSRASTTEKENDISSTIKRKPSYPSSLGSGPLSRPTPRMVSNPIISPRASSDPSPTLEDDMEIPTALVQPHGQRSVSAPMDRSHGSLSSSTREGLTGETSRSLAGLNDALSKLKMRRMEHNAPGYSISSSITTPSISITDTSVQTMPLSDRPSNLSSSTSTSRPESRVLGSSGHRPRSSIHPGDLSISSDEGEGVGDQSIAAMLCSTNGSNCLNGVRAFVDVRTDDGEDSSRVFVDILKGLGARVFARPSETCTHIIFKSGKPSTLSWYRKQKQEQEDRYQDEDRDQDTPKTFIVGIKWVMRCKKFGRKLDEKDYEVDISEEDVFQKKRKSMEPKTLAASQGLGIGLGQPSTVRKALLDVAEARKRSMMYAPRIPSPLKKGYTGISRSNDNSDD